MKDYEYTDFPVGDLADDWLKKNPIGTPDNDSRQDAVKIAQLQEEFVRYGRSYPKTPYPEYEGVKRIGPQTSDAKPTEGIRFVESADGQFVGYINDVGPEAKAAGIREVNIWNPPYLKNKKRMRLPLVDTEITLVGDHSRDCEEFKIYVDPEGQYTKIHYGAGKPNDLKPADVTREDLKVIRSVLERAKRKLPPLS